MNNFKLTLVLMAGLPGTGKSTLARALGSELGWYVIDKDRYKDDFLNLKDDRTEQRLEDGKASELAYKKSFDIARYMLTQQQTSVILDSAVLDHNTLDNALDIIYSFENLELKVILCISSRDKRAKRVQDKSSSFTNTLQVDPATKADYLQLFKHLPNVRLELDTDDSLEKCLEEAKKYLTRIPVGISSSHNEE